MANAIGGGFNIPDNTGRFNKLGQTGQGAQENSAPTINTDDNVSIGRAAAAPSREDNVPPALAETRSNEVPQQVREAAARPGVPTVLSMDEVNAVSAIGGKGNEDGGGLTGLNSLSSVVATGQFLGLNGSYGQKNPFSF